MPTSVLYRVLIHWYVLDPLVRKICINLEKNAQKLEDVEQILESCIQTLQELDHDFLFPSDQYCTFNLEYADDLLRLLSSLFFIWQAYASTTTVEKK